MPFFLNQLALGTFYFFTLLVGEVSLLSQTCSSATDFQHEETCSQEHPSWNLNMLFCYVSWILKTGFSVVIESCLLYKFSDYINTGLTTVSCFFSSIFRDCSSLVIFSNTFILRYLGHWLSTSQQILKLYITTLISPFKFTPGKLIFKTPL